MSEERITEPGWYWYDTEYTDEGSCGPFDTEEAAVASALEYASAVLREFDVTETERRLELLRWARAREAK